MAVKSEEIQLRIVASGNAAKKELADLAQTQEDLKRKIDGLDKKSKDYAATKRKLTAELQQTNERMRKLRSEMDLNSMSMRDLRNRANDLKRVMDNMKPNTPEWNRLNGQLQQTNARMRELRGSTQQLRGGWENMMGSVKGGMVAGGIGAAVGLFAIGFNKLKDAVVETTIQFQKMEAVLTLALGSKSAAKKSMEDLKQFAATTPFQIDALTESYVKLVNRGFQPTMDEMRKMGDLASSTGKEMDQLVEAILDAQTGEFERLKEFGIRASKSGDQVSFAFKGIETQVELTEDAIRNAILSFGEMEGVQGSMDAISKTLGGRLSNLQDNFTQMAYELGVLFTNMFDMNAAADTLGEGVSSLTKGIQRFAEGVLQARQWMRDWYDDSVVLRGAVQLLSAGVKTNILFLVQFLDMAIVKPIQGIIAGIKATRLVMEGEFKQAGAVLKDHFNAVVDDWKQFGSEYKGIWSDAIDEVRNPQPWKDMEVNAKASTTKVVEDIAAVQESVKQLNELLKKGGKSEVKSFDEYLAGDTVDADPTQMMGNTDDAAVQQWIEKRQEFMETMAAMRRTAREQELYETEQHYEELRRLNVHYQVGATDILEQERAALAAINKKWDDAELDALRQQEQAKQDIKRETFQQAANMTSQFLDFIGQYMEKGSAAQIATASAQIAVDTAGSISSAIAGATKAAADGGPTAPFLLLGYITSMIGSVMGAFTQVKSMMDAAQQANVDTELDVPQFAKGTPGSAVTPPGWKLVGEEGPELIHTPGGDKVLTADDTAQILAKYNMGNIATMPKPSFQVDTRSLMKSIHNSMPSFANGTMGALNEFYRSQPAVSSNQNAGIGSLENLLKELIVATREEKARPAIVSQRQLKDRDTDINYIKDFSDIRS